MTSTTLISASETTQQSRSFLECIYDHFLTHVIEQQMRGSTLLDLILREKKKKLIMDVKVGAALAAGTMR